MDIEFLRKQLAAGKVGIEVVAHGAIEALKDGIQLPDIEHALKQGEVIEDYGERALLLDFILGTTIPIHVVAEYTAFYPRVFVVTTYIPDDEHWQRDWKTRKRRRRGD